MDTLIAATNPRLRDVLDPELQSSLLAALVDIK